ncbi:hypothetical protein N9L68_05620, partial [bacterium]|nr:hypothetical protein [bacterium]
ADVLHILPLLHPGSSCLGRPRRGPFLFAARPRSPCVGRLKGHISHTPPSSRLPAADDLSSPPGSLSSASCSAPSFPLAQPTFRRLAPAFSSDSPAASLPFLWRSRPFADSPLLSSLILSFPSSFSADDLSPPRPSSSASFSFAFFPLRFFPPWEPARIFPKLPAQSYASARRSPRGLASFPERLYPPARSSSSSAWCLPSPPDLGKSLTEGGLLPPER